MAESPEITLARRIGEFRYSPRDYAKFAFPWGSEKLPELGLRSWQDEMLHQIEEHLQNPLTRHMPLRIARASGHGIGKGRCKSTLFLTPCGPYTADGKAGGMALKLWGDLKVGDFVFGADGALTRIVATNDYRRQHYRVTFDDGSSTVVSGEHEWNVRGRQERRRGLDGWRTIETQEIIALGVKRPNGKSLARQWEIPIQGAVQFETAAGLPLDPYVMGVWLSDGSKGRITKSSPAVRDKLRQRHHGAVVEHAGGKGVGIHSVDWSADPVLRCRSWEKYIPDRYKFASVEQRRALFEGLCDGDGEVNASSSIGYSSSSERLVDDMIWLARSLGYKARKQPTVKHPTYTHGGERRDGRPSYRATINCPTNPFIHEGRAAAWKPSEARYLSRWIDSIEPVGIMDGMCITVEAEDHLYLADDFIVTHNSAGISVVNKWALDTLVDTRIVITANTEGQLLTKTSPELAKWNALSITSHWFKANAMSLASLEPGHGQSWRSDLVTWSERSTEAFAGLHNKGRRIVLLFDESSGIIDKIWEVSMGALTDEGTEIIWLALGNPTKNTGAFRRAFGKDRSLWNTAQIDSRTVEGTNKPYLQQIVDTYGEKHDITRVRVLGQFPSASSMQFIGTDLVAAAQERPLPETLPSDPVVFGVDCARFGDDKSVLAIRCGRDARSRPWKVWEHMDSMTIAGDIALEARRWHPEAIMVDAGNIGGAVIDRLRQLLGPDVPVIEVWFGGAGGETELDPGITMRTKNKRALMWTKMRHWLAGGCIPPTQELDDDLVGPEYGFDEDQAIILERKKDMKKRGLPSPDHGDALACTFSEPIMPRTVPEYLNPENYDHLSGDRYSELD